MEHSIIRVVLRPIKLAFLVMPNDRQALMQAIEINSFLWGGVYNPIIPSFGRTSKRSKDKLMKVLTAKKIIEGYMRIFDPDFIVPMGNYNKCNSIFEKDKIISYSKILEDVEKDRTPKFGLGLFEILNYFIRTELKFIRRKPMNIITPNFEKKYAAFLISIFGNLSDKLTRLFINQYENQLTAKKVKCSIENYLKFLKADTLFIRRFGSQFLKMKVRRSPLSNNCIFLLDATNTLDLMDYWNLRALGLNIIPFPKQSFSNNNQKEIINEFIRENYEKDPLFKNSFLKTAIIKSRSITKSEFNDFISSIDNETGKKVEIYSAFPRIWDDQGRHPRFSECCSIVGDVAEYYFPSFQENFNIKTLDPKFIKSYRGHGTPRFANEIEFRSFGAKELVAEVIPEGDSKLARAISGFVSREWRFSRKGIVFLSYYDNWNISFKIPKASIVFMEWLKAKKWTAKFPNTYYVATQMLKHLGGKWGVSIIANKRLIKFLGEKKETKSINAGYLVSRIKEMIKSPEFGLIRNPDKILKHFIDINMFCLGVEIQCSKCRKLSWFSVEDFSYTMKCPKCLELFPIPANPKKEIHWVFRKYGPFSLPDYAQGSYTVLLTLRFFSQILNGYTTTILGFTAQKGNTNIEVDIALFYKDSRLISDTKRLIFVECKSFNAFENDDLRRLMIIAKNFPGATIAISTFNEALSKKEKMLLRKLKRVCYRRYPYNPILILTATELFSHYERPPECWAKSTTSHRKFAKQYGNRFLDLSEICHASQKLYLEVDNLVRLKKRKSKK